MKKLATILCILLLASCQKDRTLEKDTTNQEIAGSNTSQGTIAAKVNGRLWKAASKSTAESGEYFAAIKDGSLQIKTFGSFADSAGIISQDQLGIYIQGVTDTGTFALTTSNYIVYNQLSDLPQYYSSQASNMGVVHITNLTDSTVSGTFECRVDNTSGSGSASIKEGAFSDVRLQ